MKRRELLRPLMALPFATFLIGKDEVKAVEPSPGKFVVFVDVNAVDLSIFDSPLPEGHPLIGSQVYPIRLRGDQSIEDIVNIYKVK